MNGKTKQIAVAATMVALLIAAGAALAGEQDFVLVNKTGADIHQLFLSPSETDDWQNDVLGQGVLENDASATIHLSFNKSKSPLWDMKVADSQGTTIEWQKLKLEGVSKVTLHFAGGQATADLE